MERTAELCRQHQLNPQVLARWKTEFLERAPLVFEQDQKRSVEQERIAERALERALAQHTPEIHHSDQGVQYAATTYTAGLQAPGVQMSMAEMGADVHHQRRGGRVVSPSELRRCDETIWTISR